MPAGLSRGALVGLILAVGGGCATPAFESWGYVHSELPYTVLYTNPAKRQFLDGTWVVDNYSKSGTPKRGPAYMSVRAFDLNDDGVIEPDEKTTVPTFDLKLVHMTTPGVLWVRAVPLSKREARQPLDALLDDYVSAIAGTGFYAEDLPYGDTDVRALRYAAKIMDKQPTRVGSHVGIEATIEIANVDQLRLDPNSREARIRIILVRPGYVFRKSIKAPVLLMIGYYNTPRYFDDVLGAFDQFVRSIRLYKAPPGNWSWGRVGTTQTRMPAGSPAGSPARR